MVSIFSITACANQQQSNPPEDQGQNQSQVPTLSISASSSPTPIPSPTFTATALPTSTIEPTPDSSPTPSASPTPTIPACTNLAELVRHLSVSDNSILDPGLFVTKSWRIENAGTCTWTKDYQFTFVNGDNLNSQESIPINQEVPPGGTIDINLLFQTPTVPDLYSAEWMLVSTDGTQFGIGELGAEPIMIAFNVREAREKKQKVIPSESCG